MNVTESTQEGLRRTWRVVVPATDIDANVEQRLTELSKTVRMPGFRPGKVPMGIMRKRYGQSVLGEVLEKTVQDSSTKVLKDQDVRPALEPKIEVVNFNEGADLEYTMAVETLPAVEPADLSGLTLERMVVPVDDAEVGKALERLAEGNREYKKVEDAREAKTGDQVVIDFAGTVDGVARPGMEGQDYPLTIGSGNFIPGFEEQLVGIKAGDARTVTVTFPADYPTAELAGQESKFEVTAKELRESGDTVIDDEFAKRLGLPDLATLKSTVREQIEGEYSAAARMKVKRALMDALADRHDFPVPQGMVDIEFDAIWRQIEQELQQSGEAAPDEDGKKEYRDIAERRVRLGLLLSEIGRRGNVQISQEELNRGMIAEARRHPGQEREVLEFFRTNPRALDSIRAPLYEDKVVDHILSTITLNDRTTTLEELTREEDETADGVEKAEKPKKVAKAKAEKTDAETGAEKPKKAKKAKAEE